MKKEILLSGILICLLFPFLSCNMGDKTVKIRFKFKPDMTLYYDEDSKGSSRSIIGDSILEDNYSEAYVSIQWKVAEIREDSTAEIERSTSWKYRNLNKRDSLWLDSTGESDNIFIYMKPNGEVMNIDSNVIKDDSRIDYIRQYYEQGLPKFPEEEISRGHSWTQAVKVVLPDGNTEASTKYEIKSFARKNGYDCAVIAYDGIMIIPVSSYENKEYKQFGGVDRITCTGHTYFAYREGFIVAQQERWILEGLRDRLYADDTVKVKVQYEYDVNYTLTGVDWE